MQITLRSPDRETKIEFAYDYLGRRTRKAVSTRTDGAWASTVDWRYACDGSNMILELDGAQSPPAVVRKYTWGLDIAGLNGQVVRSSTSPQGAAGIGGLLAVYDTAGTTQAGSGPGGDPLADDRTFLYFYDANGNVGQLVETTGGPGGANPQAPPDPAYGTPAGAGGCQRCPSAARPSSFTAA